MNLIEAAKMALDALDSDNPDIQLRAATHLRAALAQPKQEPVAWIAPDGSIRKDRQAQRFNEWAWGDEDFRPLYTAPPQRECCCGDSSELNVVHRADAPCFHYEKHEWQGLTDEERQECLYSDPIFGMAASTFARAIEAKLKEKNS